MSPIVYAVVVTHRRPEPLAESLRVLSTQTRPVDHLIVVDNDAANDPGGRVRALVESQPVPTTYLGSRHNLGGAGGFALGMLHALAAGADWIWLADDDGRPEGPEVLGTLLDCAAAHRLAQVSPMVCNIDDPDLLAFPLRRGLVWRRRVSELHAEPAGITDGGPRARGTTPLTEPAGTTDGGPRARGTTPLTEPAEPTDLLPGIASLFNGALFAASTLDAVGVPDLRLFVRGDEVEMHRRLVRSGLPFGTCLSTRYLHPCGTDEFKPILGGRMHTQYPDNAAKRYYTYRNRGYLLSQPGMRRLLPQEWLRFGWYFLVTRRDPAGLGEWIRLRRLGRRERFTAEGGSR